MAINRVMGQRQKTTEREACVCGGAFNRYRLYCYRGKKWYVGLYTTAWVGEKYRNRGINIIEVIVIQ